MGLNPLHPARWVLDQLAEDGWPRTKLISFTRASTLAMASGDTSSAEVIKAGFGSDHVLAELPEEDRPAAYGYYWYSGKDETDRRLSREAFHRERALTARLLGARRVIQIAQRGSTPHFDWYTMAYCDQGNFGKLLSREPAVLQPERLLVGLRVLADAADGLAELHQAGVIHRDVYQENILINQGRGIITDLGAARSIDEPDETPGRGPEVHWPPEYRHAYSTAGPEADVYSLAVLAYRFCTGDLPRYDSAGRGDTLPEPLRKLLPAALASRPEARPSMTQLSEGLVSAADSASTVSRTDT